MDRMEMAEAVVEALAAANDGITGRAWQGDSGETRVYLEYSYGNKRDRRSSAQYLSIAEDGTVRHSLPGPAEAAADIARAAIAAMVPA